MTSGSARPRTAPSDRGSAHRATPPLPLFGAATQPVHAEAVVVGVHEQPAATREASTLVPRLREYLRERLPDYMVPSAFVVLDRLPLTVNGKLDVRALPRRTPRRGRSARAPETAEEKAVCALFGEVLGVADVGADDDFFDLGGHSLLAARLAAEGPLGLGVDLAIRDVFGAPTPAALGRPHGPARGRRPGRRPTRARGAAAPGRRTAVVCAAAPGLLGQFADAGTAYHEPVAARLHGPLDRDALRSGRPRRRGAARGAAHHLRRGR
ncbi:phosphopantetheine-binding protein [Yinghuangia aomiensis]